MASRRVDGAGRRRHLADWLTRRWASVAAALILVGLLAALAWSAGGYFPVSHLRAGAIALGASGAVLLARPRGLTATRRGLVALAALALLALWTGMSAGWSPTAAVAVEDFQRDLVYVGLFGLGLLAVSSQRVAGLLPWAGLGLAVAVAGYAVAGRLQPDLVAPASTSDLNGYRLSEPLGYWNALGAMATVGLVLAVGLAGSASHRTPARAAAAAAAVLLALAGYLSLSRGAWIALAAGLLVLLAVMPERRSVLVTGGIVAGCAGALVTALQAYPALIDDPHAGAGQLAAGDAFTPSVVFALGVAAGLQALAAGTQRALALAVAPRALQRALVAGLVLAGIAGGVAYARQTAAAEGHAAGGIIGAQNYVGRQWDEFWSPRTYTATGRGRLTSASGTRSALYRVAWHGWRTQPLRGEGAGSFEVRWMRDRTVEEKVRDAHSLYLESMTELGAVGLLLVLGFFAAVLAGTVVALRRHRRRDGARAAAVTAALAAWMTHAGLDWDWQMPALTGLMLLLAATLCAPGIGARRRRRRMTA